MDTKEFSETYNLHFGAKAEEIDPTTLATSLLSLTTLVNELNQELHTNKKIELRVKPFQPGSFGVPIEFIQIALAAVLSSPNVSYIKEIIDFIVSLLNLKKHLKGSKPKEIKQIGDKIEIINRDGNVFITDNRTVNVYKENTIITGAFEKQFQRLEDDIAISDFKIMDENKKSIIQVPRDEFKNMREPQVEVIEKKTTREKAKLNVFKIVFDERSKWEVFYRGIRIPVKIQDEDFNKKVLNGEKFANGDALEVELEIEQEFDETANTFVNKSYKVVKVIKHIPRDEQTSFDI